MKVKFDGKRITGEDKRIMELFGAEDCYFAEEELCQILGTTVDEFRAYVASFQQREPEAYAHYFGCRRNSARQLKFEKNIHKVSSDYLDVEFEWNREQEFINNNGTAETARRYDEDKAKKRHSEFYAEE